MFRTRTMRSDQLAATTLAICVAVPVLATSEAWAGSRDFTPRWRGGVSVVGGWDHKGACDLREDTLGCGGGFPFYGPDLRLGRLVSREHELALVAGFRDGGLHDMYQLGVEGRVRPSSRVWLGLTLGGLLSDDQYVLNRETHHRLGAGFLLRFSLIVSIARLGPTQLELEARAAYMHFEGEDQRWLERAVRTGGRAATSLAVSLRF